MLSIWRWNGEHLYENFEKYNYYGCNAGKAADSYMQFYFRPLVPTDTHVPLIYVLAVLCVSRLTEGYFYGVLASMVAVVGVNYIFTYPYFPSGFLL